MSQTFSVTIYGNNLLDKFIVERRCIHIENFINKHIGCPTPKINRFLNRAINLQYRIDNELDPAEKQKLIDILFEVKNLIRTLPNNIDIVIMNLRYMQNRSIESIAEETHYSVSGVNKIIKKAKVILNEQLENR